ncbi:MAG TPA: hypothetical protein VHO91_10445, partial [Rhodopila sp.]|nr:hypothetical protein [Rhodopila sp.]
MRHVAAGLAATVRLRHHNKKWHTGTLKEYWGEFMSVSAARPTSVGASTSRPMTVDEKKIILASSLGTVFEWYDFYLYGSLAAIIGAKFFSQFDETTRNIFALLAFAAGFLVRPFGALVFGRLG